MNIKEEIRNESCFLDVSSQNEREIFSKDLLNKIKSETVTSGSDCDIDTKTEIEKETVVSKFRSQNEETFITGDPVMGYNKASNGSIFEPKIEIKEEQCLEETISTENLSIYDEIKVEVEEDFNYAESPSLYKEGISSNTSDLFSNEDLGNDIDLNMRKEGPECESSRKCESQESAVAVIPTLETSAYSEVPHDGKIVSMKTSSKQNNSLQQNNTNKKDLKNKSCKSVLNSEHRNSHKCSICEKSFKFASRLKKHSLIHDDKKIKCDVCDKGFNHLSLLKGHKLIHEGKKPHKCDICEKAFTDLNNFKRHKLIHEGKKPYKCNICENTFTQSQHLNRHKLIHGPRKKSFMCDICGKTFAHLTNLKTHGLTHDGKKPYKCDICEKAFNQSTHLKRHKLIHEEIKPYKCDICDKPFTDLSNLKKHKSLHEEKKPLWCNCCNRTFSRSNHFKAHKCAYDGKKPH